jgi:hypothetical protein
MCDLMMREGSDENLEIKESEECIYVRLMNA